MTHITRNPLKQPSRRIRWAIPSTISLVTISLFISTSCALAQSIKGGQPGQRLQPVTTTSPSTFQSPVGQLRQKQQQQQQADYQQRGPSQSTASPLTSKRRAPQAPIQQQQLPVDNYREDRFQANQQQQQQSSTEDPLADSEPALYGSVAGAPGVDFPAYTQIPKTSFTCEGKGFDFGFYADEEAQCQVYHVCWSGRRESFLCGVGTVFNQAILACDYWHSVDCSKSSQFYGVNSELGKAGAEPASGNQQQTQAPRQRPISPANLPARTSSGVSQFDEQQQIPVSSNTFGEPLNQRRVTQQSYSNEDSSFDTPQQQQQQQQPAARTTSAQSYTTGGNSGFNQQRIEQTPDAKGATRAQTNYAPATTPAAVSRPRFNMDFNQKVNSLIESPVRAPLGKSPSVKRQQSSSPPPPPVAAKSAATTTTRRPYQQQVPNVAQLAVARAEQKAQSQAQKSKPIQQVRYSQPQQQRIQEQQQLDSDLNEPQQQQQQNFDDSPVQTSTSPAIQQQRVYNNNQPRQNNNNNNQFVQQQMVIQSGGNSPDGSSAITTQYDTMTPVNQFSQQQQQQQSQATNDYNQDSQYDSSLDDSQSNSDDFRSSGAKAAASQNQNWYIMRTI